MSTLVPVKPSGLNAMTANLVVTMDDVVSAFVSKYETNLFTRKKELSAELTRAQAERKELVESVKARVVPEEYNQSLPLGLVAEASKDVTLDFEKGRAALTLVVRVKGLATERDPYNYGRNSNTISIVQHEDLRKADIAAYEQITKLIDATEKDLVEVLDKIKSVARKEREVRGKIAMRKIEESGYAPLIEDPQLLELVQL